MSIDGRTWVRWIWRISFYSPFCSASYPHNQQSTLFLRDDGARLRLTGALHIYSHLPYFPTILISKRCVLTRNPAHF